MKQTTKKLIRVLSLQKNAIRILEINDYPKEVVKEAIEIAKELDKIYLEKNTTGNNAYNS